LLMIILRSMLLLMINLRSMLLLMIILGFTRCGTRSCGETPPASLWRYRKHCIPIMHTTSAGQWSEGWELRSV
jgi:hypothetical protein